MPNVLDAEGLQTATREELITYFTEKYQQIYGDDINLDSNTPDGQMLNIFVQAILDVSDLLVAVYTSFDPDQAIGTVLDQRIAINGVVVPSGTYSVTPITLVNTASVNLYGIDQSEEQDAQEIYTIADNDGNRWLLIDTQLGLAAGTHILDFRAEVPGAQLTTPNTINVPISIVLGVSTVNNPDVQTVVGVNEPSDVAKRMLRIKSVSRPAVGYYDALVAELLAVEGVTVVRVIENDSDVEVDGVPPHSIWVIVGGTATDAAIATAIYRKRSGGCGMLGDQSYEIQQTPTQTFTVRWDAAQITYVVVKAQIETIDGTLPDLDELRASLAEKLNDANQDANTNINEVSTMIQEIDPNVVSTFQYYEAQPSFYDDFGPQGAGIGAITRFHVTSDGIPVAGRMWFTYKGNNNLSNLVNYNDSAATIQTKLRTIPGLENVVVSGSLTTSQNFIISNLGDLDELIGMRLLDAPYFAKMTCEYQNVKQATGIQGEFVFTPENIFLLPMQVLPRNAQVANGDTLQMLGKGGSGVYGYQLTGPGGTSIDSVTGILTAGPIPGTADVTVFDMFGNTAGVLVEII